MIEKLNLDIVYQTSFFPKLFLASISVWILIFLLFYLWIYLKKLNNRQMLHIVFSALVAWGSTEFIKNIVGSLRPYQVNGNPPLTLTIPTGPSYPSSHTALAFAIATAVFLYQKKYAVVFFLLAFCAGIGRVFANVHYPIDVVGGMLWGVFISLISEKLFRKG